MVSVSTAAYFSRATQQLGDLRNRAQELQQQIGSGVRLSRSSDDPAAAARLRDIARQTRLIEVDRGNSDRASTDLRLADQALGSMADVIIRAKELALQANSTSVTPEAQKAIATEIDNLRNNLLGLANSRDAQGNALFGGEEAGNAFNETAGVVTYNGFGDAPYTDLGDGQSVQRTMVGTEVLGDDADNIFAVLAKLSDDLKTGGAIALAGANDALAPLDAGLERITTAQTVIGTRQAWVETIDDRRTETSELLTEQQSDVGGADLATTISRLQEVLTVLEASQASFMKLSNLTLVNQLS